jgi:hypothetical protein
MSNEKGPSLGRRTWITRSLVVLAAVPVLGACGESAVQCGVAALSAEQQSARLALHYSDASADPARACHACRLYTGGQDACGTCTVVAGPVHPQGSCDAFAARS